MANGEPPSAGLLRELGAAADLIVAADGGAHAAMAAGLRVDMAVGDLDSLGGEARESLGDRVLLRADPNRTDLQKAIDYCLEGGCGEVDIAAAGGGRADHALANLALLTLSRGKARLRIVDDLFEVSLVEGTAVVDAPPGTVVSLVAIGECRGVSTSGLRWDLDRKTLAFSPLGIHNEVATTPATVSVGSGDLLLFRGRWVEKHR
ncbi:MAG: thiamine diphosphokinase [Chloroflexi bacterium]|nr:thiamine diphosphokinase [Chloroflexota bacterium]